jgi:predicted amidohydrolase YtcJ
VWLRHRQPGAGFLDAGQLPTYVIELAALGFQCHFHAPSDTRPHLAHLQVVHPSDVPRLARRGAIANIQPLWMAREPQVDRLIILFLGPERAAWQYPFGALQRSGARLAAGSDWPVSSPDPLQGIHVAGGRVTPDGGDTPVSLPAEQIGLAEALTVFTTGSAM